MKNEIHCESTSTSGKKLKESRQNEWSLRPCNHSIFTWWSFISSRICSGSRKEGVYRGNWCSIFLLFPQNCTGLNPLSSRLVYKTASHLDNVHVQNQLSSMSKDRNLLKHIVWKSVACYYDTSKRLPKHVSTSSSIVVQGMWNFVICHSLSLFVTLMSVDWLKCSHWTTEQIFFSISYTER